MVTVTGMEILRRDEQAYSGPTRKTRFDLATASSSHDRNGQFCRQTSNAVVRVGIEPKAPGICRQRSAKRTRTGGGGDGGRSVCRNRTALANRRRASEPSLHRPFKFLVRRSQ
jgi:hypothetical protein